MVLIPGEKLIVLFYFGFIFFKLPNIISPALRRKCSVDQTLAATVAAQATLNKSIGKGG